MDQAVLENQIFWGNSENAVRIQVFTSIIAYCLVAIIRAELKIYDSIYEIIQVLGISMFDKTPINDLVKVVKINDDIEQCYSLLNVCLL
jgi:hypothetical protein